MELKLEFRFHHRRDLSILVFIISVGSDSMSFITAVLATVLSSLVFSILTTHRRTQCDAIVDRFYDTRDCWKHWHQFWNGRLRSCRSVCYDCAFLSVDGPRSELGRAWAIQKTEINSSVNMQETTMYQSSKSLIKGVENRSVHETR